MPSSVRRCVHRQAQRVERALPEHGGACFGGRSRFVEQVGLFDELAWSPAFRACFSTMWRAEALACSANLRCSSTSDLPVPSVLTGPRACRRPCWFLRLGGSCCSTAKVMRRYGASLFHSSPVRTSGWICAPTILMAACVNTCGRSGHAAMPSSFSGAMSGFCWLPEPGRSG